MNAISILERDRLNFQPGLPKVLLDFSNLAPQPSQMPHEENELSKLFPKTNKQPFLSFVREAALKHVPLKVGVVLSGGQAAGGHNVISGIFDALKKLNSKSRLFGFLHGPSGIIENKFSELTAEVIAPYRNMGGFDMIGSGRTKIESPEQFQAAVKTVRGLDLDGLVVIGGDDSNTNAALLAEHFLENGLKTGVIGVPKTIDGDLKNEFLEISFGFDTACKTYSEYIGNILRDALSAGKYYFFIKVMGRSASHIALECALQTHPNKTLIGEEVELKKQTLKAITDELCDMIVARSAQGKDYGVIVIPEGLIEFIPECKILIQELNAALASQDDVSKLLTPASAACLHSLPHEIQAQLLLDRDPHGNVQVSKIETERLLIEMVKKELKQRKIYKGKFSPQPLFCGYEGRSCFPSNFDARYCYALGHVAALLIDHGKTGYMAALSGLAKPFEEWKIAGFPLVGLMTLETRKGKQKPVIRKALVDLEDQPFLQFKEVRDSWMLSDQYRYPGPIQFFGSAELTDATTFTLKTTEDTEETG